MRNDAYWRQRMKMLEDALLDDSYEFVQNLEKQFALADKALADEIAGWFQRFADVNEVTLAEARKILTAKELEEFRWTVEEYIEKGQDLSASWQKQLENASIRVHISRLDSLKIQLQQHAEELAAKTLEAEAQLSSVFTEGYYHTAFEIQKGFGYSWSLHSIDKNQIAKVLSRPWSVDGKTFTDRCWTNKEALVNAVNTQLTQMIMRGEPPDKAIKAITHEFGVAKNKAGRLVMTERAAFAAVARQECFQDLDVEEFSVIATLDGETCSLCGDLDGKHYKMSEYEVGVTAPPFHPWCRCTTAPYYDDWDELKVQRYRAARDKEGKTYDVPASMTYNEWKKLAFTNPKLDDIMIHRSVGAKAKNYDVMDLRNGNMYHFIEDAKIQDVTVFAGKGSKSVYDKAYKFVNKYGGKAEDWQHVKGKGWIATDDGDRYVEVHWSQCKDIGKVDFFIKDWLDD